MLHTQIEDASICWAATFFLSVVFRHSFHRYLVFGDYVGGYKASLARMYGGYSIIIVLSTLFNILMTRVATFSHYVAWILTLLWTVCDCVCAFCRLLSATTHRRRRISHSWFRPSVFFLSGHCELLHLEKIVVLWWQQKREFLKRWRKRASTELQSIERLLPSYHTVTTAHVVWLQKCCFFTRPCV